MSLRPGRSLGEEPHDAPLSTRRIHRIDPLALEAGGVRTGLHVCRGNWSRDDSTLLRGSYAPLSPGFARIGVTQLVLEYATPRAGEVVAVGDHELGFGVVNPRSDEVETPTEICRRVMDCIRTISAERVFLNPDCGFGTFAARPVNSAAIAAAKLGSMVEAARRLRDSNVSGNLSRVVASNGFSERNLLRFGGRFGVPPH